MGDHSLSIPSAKDQKRLAILTVVFRAMGESAGGGRACLLSVDEHEFAYVRGEFELIPPSFRYAQLGESQPNEDSVVLEAKLIAIQANDATVIGVFVSGDHFSEFRYKLVYSEGVWEIASKEFIRAS